MLDSKQTPAQKVDDRTAIIETIHAETTAFKDCDFEGWARCWVQDPRSREVSQSSAFGLVLQNGWAQISAEMQKIFEKGSVCQMVAFTQKNHQITVHGDMAWVVFDGTSTDPDGVTMETFETRILERGKDGWKFAYSAFYVLDGDRAAPGQLAVDSKGQVVWQAKDLGDRLTCHPALTLSHGRLRARRSEWEVTLRAALDCAAELHSFFEQQRFTDETGRPFEMPLIFDEDAEGKHIICRLCVRDGLTYLDIDPEARLDRQLAAAQAVFALSASQAALAKQIAKGETLGTAAEVMGISINTARTHLTRIYEKTGVNSQTALVRLLLSVG